MIAKADAPSPIPNDRPVFGPEAESVFQLLLSAIKREYKTEDMYDVLAALNARNVVLGRDSKISIAAYVDVRDGEREIIRESASTLPTMSVSMYLGILAFRSGGDLDKFVDEVARLARVFGHTSKVLEQIGVPRTPEPQAQGG